MNGVLEYVFNEQFYEGMPYIKTIMTDFNSSLYKSENDTVHHLWKFDNYCHTFLVDPSSIYCTVHCECSIDRK